VGQAYGGDVAGVGDQADEDAPLVDAGERTMHPLVHDEGGRELTHAALIKQGTEVAHRILLLRRMAQRGRAGDVRQDSAHRRDQRGLQ